MTKLNDLILSTDIGGTHIYSALFDVKKNVIVGESSINTYYDSFSDRSHIVQVWSDHFLNFKNLFLKHAIALPGPFDYKEGIGLYKKHSKLGSLRDENFFSLFKKISYGQAELIFENDAICFGLGEHILLGNKFKPSLYITLGTGLGTCYIKENLVCASFSDGTKSNDLYAKLYRDAFVEDYFSTRWFTRFYKEKTSKEVLGLKEILDQNEQNIIEEMFDIFSENLLDFFVPLIVQNKIERFVIGGSISKAHPRISPKFENALKNHKVELVYSNSLSNSIIIGAASLF